MNSNEGNNDIKYWKQRAKRYNCLQWVNDNSYMQVFIRAGDFQKTDTVLDFGTGTGVVAHAIVPLVKEVIGLDKSQAMLEHSSWHGNKYFIKRNILDPIFKDEVFDKVTARHVFHHMLKDTQKAMDECCRVLKKGGKMIFSEGVPPSPEVKNDYIEIFKLKEERLTFTEADMVTLMENAGFKDIKVIIYMLRKMSVRNWLTNSGLPKATQDKFLIYISMPEITSRMPTTWWAVGSDCLIDVKMAIVTGEKY